MPDVLGGIVRIADLKIANGQSQSNWVPLQDAINILLIAPATLDAHTYTILVNSEIDGSGVTGTLNNGTSDIAPPAAGKAINFSMEAIPAIAIKDTTGTAAADRIFKVRAYA